MMTARSKERNGAWAIVTIREGGVAPLAKAGGFHYSLSGCGWRTVRHEWAALGTCGPVSESKISATTVCRSGRGSVYSALSTLYIFNWDVPVKSGTGNK